VVRRLVRRRRKEVVGLVVLVMERGGRVRDRHRGVRGGRGHQVNRDGTKVMVLMLVLWLLLVVGLILVLVQVRGEVLLVVVEGHRHRLRRHSDQHPSWRRCVHRRRRGRRLATRSVRFKHRAGVTTRCSARWNIASAPHTKEQRGVPYGRGRSLRGARDSASAGG